MTGHSGPRRHVVAVRAHTAEVERWRVAARGAGRASVARWARETLNAAAGPGSGAPPTGGAGLAAEDRALLVEALGQLARVGNNLNQLARAANMGEVHAAEIDRERARLLELVAKIDQALP